MRATFDADTLSSALGLVSGAISSRAVVDTLRSALLAVDGESCIVAGTDMEVAVRVTVPFTDGGSGVLLAPMQLKEIADLSEGDLKLAIDGKAVTVTTSAGTYQLPTANVADWPNLGEPEGEPTLTLPADELAKALARVTFAAAKDEGKYATRSVYWDLSNLSSEGVDLAATDGKRLAISRLAISGLRPTGVCGMLVPPKAMTLLAKLCTGGDVKVWFPSGPKGLAHFHTDAGQLSTRLVEGRFPPYVEVIPTKKNIKGRASFTAGPFLHAVRSAAVLTDEESKRVSFSFDSGKVALRAQGATTGKADVAMALDYDGPAMEVHLDPAFVVEMLRVLSADESVTLELISSDKSVVFRAGKDYLYLVVPLV